MSIKIQSIGALFVALVIILAINPTIVHNMYGSILGRLFLILIVVFFAINNITLGLLIVLTIITALNQYGSFVEGMTTISTSDNSTSDNSTSDNNDKPIGIDREDLRTTMRPRSSREISINPFMNRSNEVQAVSSDILRESFSSYATL